LPFLRPQESIDGRWLKAAILGLLAVLSQAGVKEGKTVGEIIELIGKKDKTIDRINALDKRIFQRDHTLILNTVRGLMTAK
jgi:hypothetical protein